MKTEKQKAATRNKFLAERYYEKAIDKILLRLRAGYNQRLTDFLRPLRRRRENYLCGEAKSGLR